MFEIGVITSLHPKMIQIVKQCELPCAERRPTASSHSIWFSTFVGSCPPHLFSWFVGMLLYGSIWIRKSHGNSVDEHPNTRELPANIRWHFLATYQTYLRLMISWLNFLGLGSRPGYSRVGRLAHPQCPWSMACRHYQAGLLLAARAQRFVDFDDLEQTERFWDARDDGLYRRDTFKDGKSNLVSLPNMGFRGNQWYSNIV